MRAGMMRIFDQAPHSFFFLPPFIKYFTVDCLHNYGAVGWVTEREKEFIRSYCCESFSFSPFLCYRSFSSLLSLIRHPHLKSHHTFKFEESCAPCECVKKRQWIYIRSGSCGRDSFSLSRREGRTKICTTISGLHHLYTCCCSILRHVSLFAFIRRCEEEARNKEESSFEGTFVVRRYCETRPLHRSKRLKAHFV